MAAASPSPLVSSVEKTNGAKLSRLLIDGGTTVLRNVFDSYHPPANLAADFNANYPTLNGLFKKRVLHRPQWDLLFPPSGAPPDSKTFDITLLFVLLTNICGLSPPLSGWHKPQPSSDTSLEANLARVKLYRNELYGHVTSTGVQTAAFNVKWQEISAVLVALGLNPTEVTRLKSEPCGEDYISALIEWVKRDEEIQSQLREVLKTQQEARQMQEQDHRTLQDTHKAVTEAHVAIQEVVETQKKNHETLQQVKKTYENMAERSNKDNEEDKILSKLARTNTQKVIDYHTERYQVGTRLSFFEKIEKWLDDRTSSNRVMVISGNAGMGKSVISAIVCKRMQKAGKLSGSHFCQHDRVRYRNAKIMLQSLAFQLSDFLPEYKNVLLKTLSQNLGEELNNMEVKDLSELLFEEPLSEVKDPGRNIFMLIDGLDESEYQGRNELLDVIANHFTKLPCWIRFLVTTRPEINIADSLKSFNPLQLESNDEENLMDIRLLFEKRLSDLIQQDHKEVILAELVRKSEGLILYAHLLTDFIKENVSLLTLEHLGNALPSGISSVYLIYFQRLETGLRKELKIEEERVLTVLSALAAAREPLQQDFVCEMMLSGKRSLADKRKVMKAIACISALLPVRDECIHFFHKSVKDWLTDISAYGQHNFTVDKKEGHGILSRLCAVKLDDVRRKGVNDLMFSDTTKYALQHGVGHMLELDDETRGCSLDEVVKKYVIDLEVVYSKLCVNSAVAAEDIERLQNLESFPVLSDESDLNTLLFLLRKYHSALTKHPGTFFQTVLNEGGAALSAEASKLLEDKHPEITYMEYLYKDVHEDAAQAIFSCSSPVACFDVSPQLDYLVCECIDATIYLWSLRTGNLQWVRPAKVEKRYSDEMKTYKASRSSPVCSCYRSVVFHPTKEVVLPGILNQAYALDGDLKPLFPESNCSFTVCSIVTSGGEIRMLTDCLDNARCIIMWSLENGSEITRVTRKEDVLSFACTRDGKMLTISHSSGSICLVDVTKGSETLAQVTSSKACGMIKFSPDNQYIFCFHETLSETRSLQDRYVFQLKITRCNNGTFSLKVLGDKVSYKPLEHESCSEAGFLSGDPFSCIFEQVESGYPIPVKIFVEGAFLFVLSKESVLRSFPGNSSIAMFTPKELRSHTASFHSHSKFRANSIAFSQTGEIVYVVATETNVERSWVRVMAWNVSSGELNAEKSIQTGKNKRIVPVKQGILLTATNDSPELWNFKLSECIRRWPHVREVTDMMPISEERVACVGKRNEVNILDTTCTDVIATIPFSYKTYEHTSQLLGREAVTCNSRCQLLCQLLTNDCQSVQLWDGTDIIWKRRWPHSLQCSYILPGMFSPTEEFVVISALTPEGDQIVYLLDAQSGKTCRMLCRGTDFFGCNFVSDEECLIDSKDASGDYLLRLFNIKSGNLIGVLVKQFRTFCLASCPLKRLVAIDVVPNYDSKRVFQVIQVKLPRDKDNKKKNKG